MAFDPNDKETQDAIKSAVEEATRAQQDKNKQLLDELKKARRGQDIDPADHAALQTELEQTQAKLADATKSLKLATGEAEKHKAAFEKESQFSHKLLVENGLTDALLKVNVKPELSKAAKAMFASQVKLEIEGESRVAKIGDKALADFISEWSKSDEGKVFISAPANQGGGANGGGGGGSTKKWSEMNLDERSAIYRSNPEQAKQLQAATS